MTKTTNTNYGGVWQYAGADGDQFDRSDVSGPAASLEDHDHGPNKGKPAVRIGPSGSPVTISGTPAAGQVLVATSSSAATWGNGLIASDVVVQEVVSSAVETTVATLTIPANTIGTSGLLYGIAQMDHLDNTAGTSHTVRVKLGGTIFYECVYTPGASASRRAIVLEFWVSGFGSTSAQVGSGRLNQGLAGSSGSPGAGGAGGDSVISSNHVSLAATSTGSLDIIITITQGTSSSSKSTKCYTAHLFKLG